MDNIFTPEQLQLANGAGSPEELLSLAKEHDIELTPEQAEQYFEKLNKQGELEDDELESVAGGGCKPSRPEDAVDDYDTCGLWSCEFCGKSWNSASQNYRQEHLCNGRAMRPYCKDCKNNYFDTKAGCLVCLKHKGR